jgi:uncharacterized delta-60 repeat protein
VLRLNADGSRDAQFPSLEVEGMPTEAAVQADGKLILGGWLNRGYPFYRDAWVSRFNTDGSGDTGFGEGGTVYVNYGAADDCTAVRLLADGKILVAGYQYTGTGRFFVATSAGPAAAGLGANGTQPLGTQVLSASAAGRRAAEADYFAARLVNDATRLTKPAAAIVTRPGRLTLRWRLWNATFPLASYDVVGHRAKWSGAMPAEPNMILATHTTTTSLRLPKAVQPGWTYRISTRAVAAGGETSAWSPKTLIVPLDERAGKRVGPWRAGTDRRCYLSTYLRSTPSKSCSIQLGRVSVVRTVGVIATTGPEAPKWRGVRVYLNKTPVKLSLRSAKTKSCQAVFVRLKKPAHNAQIRVVVLADRPVTIEGIILSPE